MPSSARRRGSGEAHDDGTLGLSVELSGWRRVGHALLKPLDGCSLWLALLPAAVTQDFSSDLVALLARDTWPLCVKSGRAACHPLVRVHRQPLCASILYKTPV